MRKRAARQVRAAGGRTDTGSREAMARRRSSRAAEGAGPEESEARVAARARQDSQSRRWAWRSLSGVAEAASRRA